MSATHFIRLAKGEVASSTADTPTAARRASSTTSCRPSDAQTTQSQPRSRSATCSVTQLIKNFAHLEPKNQGILSLSQKIQFNIIWYMLPCADEDWFTLVPQAGGDRNMKLRHTLEWDAHIHFKLPAELIAQQPQQPLALYVAPAQCC